MHSKSVRVFCLFIRIQIYQTHAYRKKKKNTSRTKKKLQNFIKHQLSIASSISNSFKVVTIVKDCKNKCCVHKNDGK